ncbi:hypothetical protein CBL_08171 [Carabus blaptoides fortunei]
MENDLHPPVLINNALDNYQELLAISDHSHVVFPLDLRDISMQNVTTTDKEAGWRRIVVKKTHRYTKSRHDTSTFTHVTAGGSMPCSTLKNQYGHACYIFITSTSSDYL